MSVFPEKGEKKRVKVRKKKGGGKKQEMQPLVFGHGHLLHSRDCENCRRVCVFLCHVLCVCVWSKCVSTHVRCCHLKRMGEANAFKPYGAQLCIDEHVKSLRLI